MSYTYAEMGTSVGLAPTGADGRETIDWAAEGMATWFGVVPEWTIGVLNKNASNNEPASPQLC